MNIAATENVDSNRQFVPRHARLSALGTILRDIVGINVNEFYHPVTVGAARGGEQVHLRPTHDVNGAIERFRRVADDIGTAVNEALVADEPAMPLIAVAHVDWARQKRYRIGGIRQILVVSRSAWALEPGFMLFAEIKRDWRSHGPAWTFFPAVHPCFVGEYRRRVGVRRAFQIMVEERLHPLG